MTSAVTPTSPGNQHPRITHDTLDHILFHFPPNTRQPHPPNHHQQEPKTNNTKASISHHQNDRPPPPLPPPPRDLRLRPPHRRRHHHHCRQLMAVRHGRRHPRSDCACARHHRVCRGDQVDAPAAAQAAVVAARLLLPHWRADHLLPVFEPGVVYERRGV